MTRITPDVSFIVPVRDDAVRLERCLESIARNDYERLEVLVVDNGSTDGSAEVAAALGARVMRLPRKRVAELRNLGARDARGSVLAFVDADHEISSGWVNAAIGALADPAVAAVGAPYHPPQDGTWVQHRYDAMRAHTPQPDDVEWLGTGNLAIRRSVFEAVGGFDVTLETCEDVDLCQRVRAAGYRIVAHPDLRSVHFGDPATLRALFVGELWRGRGNLRVTLRGPRTLRHFRSLLVPVAQLTALAGAGLGALAGLWPLSAAALLGAVAPTSVRALRMLQRDAAPGARPLETIAVALVYDIARALALVGRTGHRLRRAG